jgi:hypothetical protein
MLSEPVALGGGVRVERIPKWVQAKESLDLESWGTRNQVERARAVFATEYETDALDENARKAGEAIWLAGLAVWLVRPCGWSVGHIFHFEGTPQTPRQTGPSNKILVEAPLFGILREGRFVAQCALCKVID